MPRFQISEDKARCNFLHVFFQYTTKAGKYEIVRSKVLNNCALRELRHVMAWDNVSGTWKYHIVDVCVWYGGNQMCEWGWRLIMSIRLTVRSFSHLRILFML